MSILDNKNTNSIAYNDEPINIRTSFLGTEDLNAQSANSMLSLSKELSLPTNVIRSDMGFAQNEVKARKVETDPRLAMWASEKPENAAMVRDYTDDFLNVSANLQSVIEEENKKTISDESVLAEDKDLNFFEKYITQPYERGQVQIKGIQAARAYLETGEEQYKEEAEKYRKEAMSYGQKELSWYEYLSPSVAIEQLPQILEMIPTQLYRAGQGFLAAGTTALIAGQLGPQAALPEEVLTVPVASALGVKTGWTIGTAESAFGLEKGAFAYEIMDMKDLNGEPIPREVLDTFSTVYAAIASGIELGGEVAFINILEKSGLGKIASGTAKQTTKRALKNALMDKTLQPIILDAAKRIAQVGVTGFAEEGLQKTVNNLVQAGMFEYIAETANTAFENVDLTEGVLEEAFMGLGASMWLSSPSVLMKSSYDYSKVRQQQNFTNKQNSIHETIEQLKTNVQNDEIVEDFLNRNFNEQLGEDIYVDAQAMQELMQEDSQLASDLNIDLVKLEEFAGAGVPYPLSLTKVHAKLDTQRYTNISQIMKSNVESYTQFDTDSFQDRIEQDQTRIHEIQDTYYQEQADFEYELDSIRQNIEEVIAYSPSLAQTIEVQGGKDNYIDAQIELIRRVASRLSEASNFSVSPVEILSRLQDIRTEVKIDQETLQLEQSKYEADKDFFEHVVGRIERDSVVSLDSVQAARDLEHMYGRKLWAKKGQGSTLDQIGEELKHVNIITDIDEIELNPYDYVTQRLLQGNNLWTKDNANKLRRQKRLQRTPTKTQQTLNQFIGEQGAARLDEAQEATIRLDNLQVARDMEEAGKEALTIKQATGWERGADNKWRYEVGDVVDVESLKQSKKYQEEVAYWKSQIEEYTKMERDTYNNIYDATKFNSAEQAATFALEGLERAKVALNNSFRNSIQSKSLSDILTHEIISAYPSLSNIRVYFVDANNYRGTFDGKTIFIDYTLSDKLIPLVLEHEIQHAIQDKEGFSRGGNIEEFQVKKDRAVEDISGVTENLHMFLKDIGFPDFMDSQISKFRNKEITIEEMRENTKKFKEDSAYSKEIASNERILRELQIEYDKYIDPDRMYESLAGEVEARNTQARLGMTEEQRRNSLAIDTEDVAREDQIILEQGKRYIAASENILLAPNGKPSNFSPDVANIYYQSENNIISEITEDQYESALFSVENDIKEANRIDYEIDVKKDSYTLEKELYKYAYEKRTNEIRLSELEEWSEIITLLEDTEKNKEKLIELLKDKDLYYEPKKTERITEEDYQDELDDAFDTAVEQAESHIEYLKDEHGYETLLESKEIEQEVFNLIYDESDKFLEANNKVIEKFISELGFIVHTDNSRVSRSTYFNIYDQNNDYIGKIRFSDHEDRHDSTDYQITFEEDLKENLYNVYNYINEMIENYNSDNVFYQDKDNARGNILTLSDNTYIINLFQNANLSTLTHELSHFFFLEMQQLERNGLANEALQKDMDILREWVGAKKGENLNTEQQEMLARGFEQYLREGKAPVANLRNVFARFSKWLRSIYKHAMKLNVQTTDEVRSVFDRMLATEQEIEIASNKVNIIPFTNKEFSEIGSTETAKNFINSLTGDIKREAEEKLITSRQKARSELKKKVTQEATETIEAQQVYKAIASIRESKMNKEEVAAVMGQEYANVLSKKMPGALTNGKGKNPQELAVENGYNSVQDFLNDVYNAKSKKEAINEIVESRLAFEDSQYVAEDVLFETKSLGAQEAQIAIELSKKLGLASNQVLSDSSIREYAKSIIYNMAVSEARQTYNFLSSARSVYKKERDAILRGDFEKALEYNTQARTNIAMAQESRKIDEYIKSVQNKIDNFVKVRNPNPRNPIARYWVNVLGYNYKMQKQLVSLWQDKDLNDIVEYAQENGIDIDMKLLYGKENYKELSYNMFTLLSEQMETVIYMERELRKIETAKGKIELEELANEISDSIYENNKARKENPFEDENKQISTIKKFFTSMLKADTILRLLDGDKLGIVWESILEPINNATHDFNRRMKPFKEKLKELYSVYSTEELSDMRKKKYVIKGFSDYAITKEKAIAIALNTGNESNLARLKKGYESVGLDDKGELTDSQIEAVKAFLDKKDWEFVQGVWDYFETFQKESFDLEEKLTGVRPKAIEATQVQTEYGTFRGGYYPIVYDSSKSGKAPASLSLEDSKGVFNMPSVAHGSMKNRQGDGLKIPLRLDLDVIGEKLSETIHNLAFREPVRNVSKILRHSTVRKSIENTAGVYQYKALQDWLVDVAGGSPVKFSGAEWYANWARTSMSVMSMGYKLSTTMTQLAGAIHAIPEIGSVNVLKGTLHTLWNMKRLRENLDEVYAKSKVMRFRIENVERDVADYNKKIFFGGNKVIQGIKENAFTPMGYVQLIAVDLPVWRGAYEKGLKDFNGDERKAIQYADNAVEVTQGSGATKDLAAIQRGSEFQKLFTMYYTFFSAVYQQMYRRTTMLARKKDLQSAWGLANYMLVGMVLSNLVSELLAGRWYDEEEEDDSFAEWALKLNLLYPFQSMPFVRDVANGLLGDYGYSLSAAETAPETVIRGIKKVIEAGYDWATGESHETDYKDVGLSFLKGVGYATKNPIFGNQTIGTMKELFDYLDGTDPEFEAWRILLGKKN